jgi:hypothetical protein
VRGLTVPLQDVFDYFRSYDNKTFEVFTCQGDEPSEADVMAFEQVVGFRLPDEFREFTRSPLGGIYMAVREELWPRAKPLQVGPFWTFLRGFTVFGIAKSIPEFLDIRVQYRKFKPQSPDLVPFMKLVDCADRYCFDVSRQIRFWDHEQPVRLEDIGGSFSDFLMKEIRELEDRWKMKLQRDSK